MKDQRRQGQIGAEELRIRRNAINDEINKIEKEINQTTDKEQQQKMLERWQYLMRQ